MSFGSDANELAWQMSRQASGNQGVLITKFSYHGNNTATTQFRTFGGNPVSCAAGLAVFEVIEAEGLQRNALEIGKYLKERLLMLQKDFPAIGGEHGSGLLLGADMTDPGGAPDPELAEEIVNQMREDGVLIGTTEKESSILKIRPPLVFQQEHAEILLESLKKALVELSN